jgi:hypothetical protein
MQKMAYVQDSRLPVTLPILQSLLAAAPGIPASCYQVCQFKAMCSMAFFAYLRIGKITKQTNNASCQPLQMDQISYVYDSSHKVVGIKLTFLDFKHHYNQRPFRLLVYRQTSCCPVALLLEYLALRGIQPKSNIFNAVERGMSNSQIRTMGRWKSNAFHKYILPIKKFNINLIACPQDLRGKVLWSGNNDNPVSASVIR